MFLAQPRRKLFFLFSFGRVEILCMKCAEALNNLHLGQTENFSVPFYKLNNLRKPLNPNYITYQKA